MYLLPWGPQGTWLREGALGRVLGDWQVTGLFSASIRHADRASAPARRVCALRTTRRRRTSTGKPEVLGGIGAETAVVRHVGLLCAGRLARGATCERNVLLTGPGYVNLDASIVKIIRVRNAACGDPGGFLQRDQHAALRQSERDARQRELRARHINSPADGADDSVRSKVLVLREVVRGFVSSWVRWFVRFVGSRSSGSNEPDEPYEPRNLFLF